MNELLNSTPAQIAKLYRERVAYVHSLPADQQWQHGEELKRLKAAFSVAKEAGQVRTN